MTLEKQPFGDVSPIQNSGYDLLTLRVSLRVYFNRWITLKFYVSWNWLWLRQPTPPTYRPPEIAGVPYDQGLWTSWTIGFPLRRPADFQPQDFGLRGYVLGRGWLIFSIPLRWIINPGDTIGSFWNDKSRRRGYQGFSGWWTILSDNMCWRSKADSQRI